LEQEGIFFFFRHEKGKHILVLADTSTAHKPCPDASSVRYEHAVGRGYNREDDVVFEWRASQEMRPGKYALNDYNFETPSTGLVSNVDSRIDQGGNRRFEIYDYPGEYLKRAEGDDLVKLRMEEQELPHAVVEGESNCRAFASGFRFELTDHERRDQNGPYVLTSVTHSAHSGGFYSGRWQEEASYANSFTCTPFSIPFRPPRNTPKPLVQGPQTAIVTGPGGEEIYTDRYGRVKVQFHWDRVGDDNEKSSCWVRVSHPWAGKNWGGISIPRIGQEVVVDFLEGDPDHPLITGRVYNAEQMPPWGLPGSQNISGIKSNSTKGGGGYNEISMDDSKGKEKITIHAQHDMSTTVRNNDSQTVYHDRTIHVDGTHTETIKKEMLVTSEEKHIYVTAANEIKLEVGASKLVMKRDGTIKLSGVKISIEGTANVQTKGTIVLSEASATNTVKGGMVLLNP